MGLFAEWQPRDAEHGVATFPLQIEGKSKKPAVKHWQRCGLKGSAQLAFKFGHSDAFAFNTGKRSGLTLVDIDSPDNEDLLREVLRRYGDTPAIVRTGSGGFHCYYRHGGEARRIRLDPAMPVDMLGQGVAAAPPSMGGSGRAYEFIRGSVANLADLPFIRDDAGKAEVQEAVRHETARAAVPVGNRNKALFEHCMREARHVDTLDDLADVARTFADDQFAAPMSDAEITRTVESAWGYETRGENRFGRAATVNLPHASIDKVLTLGADAVALFVYLKRKSGHRGELIVANDMRKTMPDGEWTLRRFAKARQALLDGGVLIETRRASTYHGPAVFAWQG